MLSVADAISQCTEILANHPPVPENASPEYTWLIFYDPATDVVRVVPDRDLLFEVGVIYASLDDLGDVARSWMCKHEVAGQIPIRLDLT